MRNENLLLQARPVLALDTQSAGQDELFQNETLRPILKLQHDLLLDVYQSQIEKRYSTFLKLPSVQRPQWIADSIRADQRLRNLMAGIILGQFTLEEYQVFRKNESELMRRLVSLLIQRIQSTDKELIGRIETEIATMGGV
jgi:hypothetical protein